MDSLTPRRSLAWVSTFGGRCGIAEYSKYMLSALPRDAWEIHVLSAQDEDSPAEGPWSVVPAWERQAEDLTGLLEEVRRIHPDRLVVQFHYDFFDLSALAAFLEEIALLGIPSTLIYHTTSPREVGGQWLNVLDRRPGLDAACSHLLHQEAEMAAFQERFGRKHVAHLVHGCAMAPERTIAEARAGSPWSLDDFVLATFGFLLPHKGIRALIQAMDPILQERPETKLLLLNARHPSAASEHLEAECRELIHRLRLEDRVWLETGFLERDEALARLQAANALVFPYGSTPESASGAVRFAAGCRRPLFLSRQPLFRDFEGQAVFLDGLEPEELAETLLYYRAVPGPGYAGLINLAAYLEAHRWDVVALDLHRHLESLSMRQA